MSGKYWEKYQEKKLKQERCCKTPTHMSDKQAYIVSLEAQIDRSQNSNLLVTTFAERIEQLQKQLNTAEERIANLARNVKIQGNEPVETIYGGYIAKLEERVSFLEQQGKKKADSYKNFSESIEGALRETEKRISKIIEDFEDKYKKTNPGLFSFGNEAFGKFENSGTRFKDMEASGKDRILSEAAENVWIAQQTCTKLAEDSLDRITGCEKRIKELKKTIENFMPNAEDIEAKVTEKLDLSIENLSGLIKGYIKVQENMMSEFKEFKDKQELKDPGIFSFGSTYPKPLEIHDGKKVKNKSESNSKEHSKEPEFKNTRKRSSSPAARVPEKKQQGKKEENVKKKNDRKSRLEKLYQNFSEKAT
ncbi:hypothetical protein SteCoe_24972 [Stentor coeruleus]|uniref:Uncharacterized protein n=1 Tax=Stentor coeruleus TaxID=5963 RepID=A0A1R2BG97_9CILI|nr:hypothetical protein SteCoe_24972 [Stentor coeruleus]